MASFAPMSLEPWGPETEDVVLENLALMALHDTDQSLRNDGDDFIQTMAACLQAVRVELMNMDPKVRCNAAQDLGGFWPESKASVPDLEVALREDDADVREAVAVVLGVLGLVAEAAMPDLVEALRDDIADVRQAAALALGSLGSEG